MERNLLHNGILYIIGGVLLLYLASFLAADARVAIHSTIGTVLGAVSILMGIGFLYMHTMKGSKGTRKKR